MILSQAQAEAVYSAMCALNNIGALYLLRVEYSTYGIRCSIDGVIDVRGGDDSYEIETYANQSEFAAAYNLN
jgi:hypothetical protein